MFNQVSQLNLVSLSKEDALNLLAKNLLKEKNLNMELLDKYTFGRYVAIGILNGLNVEEAKQYGLESCKINRGYNEIYFKHGTPLEPNYLAYDEFLSMVYSGVNVYLLSNYANKINFDNLKNICNELQKIQSLMNLGASFSDSVDFAKNSLP